MKNSGAKVAYAGAKQIDRRGWGNAFIFTKCKYFCLIKYWHDWLCFYVIIILYRLSGESNSSSSDSEMSENESNSVKYDGKKWDPNLKINYIWN